MLRYIKKHTVNIMSMILIFCAATLINPAPAQATGPYSDIGYHWAGAAIARWDALGALQDFPSGAFRPDAPITRAEFFSILVRALGTTKTADISRFTDVPSDAWYYDIVSKAHQMRIAEGTSESTMAPLDNIIRQDAATLVARAMGLSNEHEIYLSRYNDNAFISDYARNYVSAITEYGYMVGNKDNFNPRANLSRAEAVKMVDNLFRHYYWPEVGFTNFMLSGNVITIRSESVFEGLTVNGDLILGDGVGDGNVTLNNCTVNGRLLIRGGGPNSIILNDTYVAGGVTVISPGSKPRVVTTGNTRAPQLNAFSSFSLVGTGVHSVAIADTAFSGVSADLQGVMLDTVYVGGVGAKLNLAEGRVVNLLVGGAAENAVCTLAAKTLVDHFSTVSPNTILSGAGRISDAFINAPGTTMDLTPDTYTVGGNLTATVGGKAVSGKSLSTANNVPRQNTRAVVSQDRSGTGGGDLRISSTPGRSSHTVLVTQTPYTAIPLDNSGSRYAYFIGFFIPAPENSRRDRVEILHYNTSDGGLISMTRVSMTTKDGVSGLEFLVPVRRDGVNERGRLNELLNIQWDEQNSENLQFHSGWLSLEPLSSSQESRLVNFYEQSRFNGLDGTRYRDEEALRRMLASDNALGLDVKGFDDFALADQEDLAARLYEFTDYFTDKKALQEKLNQVLSGKAALFAINNAVTTWQMRDALENTFFAKELNIEVGSGSTYDALSGASKERVARVLLTGRTKEYATAQAVKTAFEKAVSDTRNAENSLLVALNRAKKAAEVQPLIENKINAEILDFNPADQPYKSADAQLKLELCQAILDGKPYYSVDPVAQIIHEFLRSWEESGLVPSYTITGLTVDPVNMSLLVGQSMPFSVFIQTTEGVVTDLAKTNIVFTNPNIIEVDTATGQVLAKAVGSAKITVAIADTATNKKFSAGINVTVKVPVPATAIKLNKTQVEIGEGESDIFLTATLTPANSTDTVTWNADNPALVGVDKNGRLTGLQAGFTTVTARTTSNLTASCAVVVVSKTPGVMVTPKTLVIGSGQTTQITAVVSPISQPNRTVKWSSSDSSVATVDPYGNVTGVGIGQAKITATANYDNTLTGECMVTVDDSIKKLTLNTRKAVMLPTGIEQLTATVTPFLDDGDKVIWDVRPFEQGGLSKEIATVDATGKVTAREPGKVYVYAYLESDSSVMAECAVEVLDATLKVTFPTTLTTIYVGDSLTTAIPAFMPASITNKTIHWEITSESTDESIATFVVNANGSLTVTGIKTGIAKLVGKPEAVDSLVINCKVTVSEVAVTKFSIAPDHIYLDEGNTVDLTDPRIFSIVMEPANATNKHIEWTSDTTGRVNVTNMPATTSDPYGPSRMVAEQTTYTSKQVPDGQGGFTTVWEDNPVLLVAKDSANHQVKVLVSVRTSAMKQVRNIKINMEQWIYPVGTQQNLTVYFNVTGRDANSGAWILGDQPPNKQLTWSSTNDSIAYVNSDNKLITLEPGQVQITARSEDGGVTDTVTVVVAAAGVKSMTFSPLNTTAGYGKFVKMFVGEENREITATIAPTTAANAPLVWQPWNWIYNPGDNNITGTTNDSRADTILSITPSNNPWSTGYLTALKPGLVLARVVPTDDFKIDTMSLTQLEQLYNSVSLLDFPTFNEYLLEKNAIVESGGNYYAQNEYQMDIQGLTTSITPRPLSKTSPLSLVAPVKVDAGSNEFFVWITHKELQGVSFIAPPANALADSTVTLSATLNPAQGVDVDTIGWEVPSELTLGTTSYDPDTGICTAEIIIPDDTALGSYTIKVTVISKADVDGPKSPTSGEPRLTQGAVTRDATLSLKVIAAPTPGLAPLTAPVAAPSVTTPQPEPQPEPAPQPLAKPALQPRPEGLPPLSEAKTFSLRSAATIPLGGEISLVPFAAPASYDLSAVTWQSAKPDIVTVDSFGNVVGIAAGRAVITATAPGTNFKRNCAITVSAAIKVRATGLALNNSGLSLEEGQAAILKAAVAPANATLKGVTWYSSDISVAKVDLVGRVTAITAGNATIYAVTDDGGFSASCAVSVSPKPVKVTGIILSQTSLLLAVGEQATLEATIQPQNATDPRVIWSSSNNNTVTVENGQITALRKGSATITVTSADGKRKATCKVTVR